MRKLCSAAQLTEFMISIESLYRNEKQMNAVK